MQAVYWMLAVLCTLNSPLESSAVLSTSSSQNPKTQVAYFYNKLEKALLNDSNTLYHLQQIFFPTTDHLNAVKVPFLINIIVESISTINTSSQLVDTVFNCSSSTTECKWCDVHVDWYPEVTADLYSDDLRQYVLSVQEKLRELEYVSWSVLQLLAKFGAREDHSVVHITLTVSELDALPGNDEASQALLSLMAWLKAYARTGSDQSVQRSDHDKGDVFFTYKEKDEYLELYILILFLSTNVFLTLMAGVFLKSFTSFLVKKATVLLKESGRMLSLYWATALVFTAANTACFIADIFAFQFTLGDGRDHKILYTKLFLIGFVLVTEPFIVYYTTRHFSVILNVPDNIVQALCCCFSNVYGSRFAHTLAVLNILWFVHRVVTAFINVLFHIVVAPAETFTTITLIFSVIIISIFITTYILLTCNTPRRKVKVRMCCRVLCALLTGAMAIAVVISFSLVYLAFLGNGLHTAGVGGFLLSLFPPLLFFTIGLIVQRKFIHHRKESNESGENEDNAVSSGTGNVTKLAKYQQSEAKRSGGHGLSIQENGANHHRQSERIKLSETDRLVETEQ